MASDNASWKIRSQHYGDSPRLSPYRSLVMDSAVPKSYRPMSLLCHTHSTNDQQVHYEIMSFIYADDLCITAQFPTFSQVESIEGTLGELTEYYRNNSLRANPDKTHVTAFHLRNREANRSLKV